MELIKRVETKQASVVTIYYTCPICKKETSNECNANWCFKICKQKACKHEGEKTFELHNGGYEGDFYLELRVNCKECGKELQDISVDDECQEIGAAIYAILEKKDGTP